MVYTVYLDLLFILDFIIDYLLLYATGKISGARIKRYRLVLAAFTGALLSLVSFFVPDTNGLFFTVAAGIITVFIAYGKRWKISLLFFGVSALFGGMTFAINYLMGSEDALNISVGALLSASAISYIIILIAFRKSATGITKKEYVHIEIEKDGKKAAFYALVDSGNSLCDPVSNTPVLIVEWDAIEMLFKKQWKNLPAEELVLRGNGKFRLVPYTTVGGSGILAAFKADRVTVDGKVRQVLVAPLVGKMTEGYSGIIGLEEED